jgi:predicted transcriptional regulator
MEIGPKVRDRRRKPADDKTIKDLARRYSAGASIRQLSTHTGWAYATVHARIKAAAAAGLVTMRPRGGVVKALRKLRNPR